MGHGIIGHMGLGVSDCKPLLCPLPYTTGRRHVHVQRADHAQLWDLDADIDQVQQPLGNAFLLLAQEQHDFRRERVVV
jgi:hypothetical protein